MDAASPSIRRLAQRLLDETRARASSRESAASQVCEVFQVSLTRFAGMDGFTSLLRRALGLANRKFPSLKSVTINADGRLEGFDDAANGSADDAAVEIIANLLGLLITFIGEPLTLKLVREAWPDVNIDV